MRRLVILGVCIHIVHMCSSPLWGADEAGVFESCAWTLYQITELKVDEGGRLRLNRDEWETASKSPFEGAAERPRPSLLGQNEPKTPIEKLFDRLNLEAENQEYSSRSTSLRRNNGGTTSWHGKRSAGKLRLSEREVCISLEELNGSRRRFEITANGEELHINYYSIAGEIILVNQTEKITRFSCTIGGKSRMLVGPSFAGIVQQNRDYFQTFTEWPEFLAELPIAEAIDSKLPAPTESIELEPAVFPEAAFLDEKLRPLHSVFVRLRIIDGRLQYNQYSGRPQVFDDEAATLNREFSEVMERSRRRMKEIGAPQVQLNQLESQFGTWKSTRVDKTRFGPFLSTFLQMQSISGGRNVNSMKDGDALRYEFDAEPLHSSILGDDASWSYRIRDGVVSLDASEDTSSLALIIATGQSLLIVGQGRNEPCSLICLNGGHCDIWKAPSWVTLVHEHEAEFRQRIVPILDRYHVSGLDPFHPDSIDILLERLKDAAPQNANVDEPMVDTDSWALPLLNDTVFLRLLAEKVSGSDQALMNARIAALSQSQVIRKK